MPLFKRQRGWPLMGETITFVDRLKMAYFTRTNGDALAERNT